MKNATTSNVEGASSKILIRCRTQFKSTSLHGLLDLLPNTLPCPNSRSSMARKISKLGQYADISKQLCSLALEVPALDSMRDAPVILPPETFGSAVPARYKPDLSTALARSVEKTTGMSTTSLDAICQKLGTTTQEASKKFTKDVGNINRDAKCHAEFQILFEYEIRSHRPAPRVVASSKSACYLCNALFLAHGRYHIPRTHGRLYRGWKLPAVHLASMKGVGAEFVNAQERAIERSLKSLLNSHGSLKIHYPNESTLTIRSSSSLSTITTDSASVAPDLVLETLDTEPTQSNDSSGIATVEAQDCLDVSHDFQPTASNPWVVRMEGNHEPVWHPDVEGSPREPASRKVSPSSSQTALRGFEHAIITLHQGEVRPINLYPGYSPIICTQNLSVHIEWPSKNMDQGRPADSCIALMAEWLSAEEADKHLSAQAIHEARILSTEFETDCSGNEDVLLGLGVGLK